MRHSASRRRLLGSALAVLGALAFGAASFRAQPVPPPTCPANCNDDAAVTIDELLRCVSAALDSAPLAACPACDRNGDARVTVDELVKGVLTALGTRVTVDGHCFRPGPTGLEPCPPGTEVGAVRCDDPRACLHDGDATSVLTFGCVGATGTGCVGENGEFSLAVDDCRIAGATLVLSATVDPEADTEYRVINFGPVAAVGTGSVVFGTGLSPAALVIEGVVISPSSEAAVRLLDENGLENFDAEGIDAIIDTVDAANATTDFAGLEAADAADLATDTAGNDPAVQDAIDRLATPTPTALPTPTASPTAVTLRVGSATGRAGEQVTFSVTLSTAGMAVAGTENRLIVPLDAPIAAAGERPACSVNPAIDKNNSGFVFEPIGCTPEANCTGIKALVFDLSNVDPIPDGSVLYTCTVKISAAAPVGVLPLTCAAAKYSPPPPAPIPAPSAECVDGEIRVVAGEP